MKTSAKIAALRKDIKLTQEQLAMVGAISPRHPKTSRTLGIYTHEFQEAQARTSDIIAETLNFDKRKEAAVS